MQARRMNIFYFDPLPPNPVQKGPVGAVEVHTFARSLEIRQRVVCVGILQTLTYQLHTPRMQPVRSQYAPLTND